MFSVSLVSSLINLCSSTKDSAIIAILSTNLELLVTFTTLVLPALYLGTEFWTAMGILHTHALHHLLYSFARLHCSLIFNRSKGFPFVQKMVLLIILVNLIQIWGQAKNVWRSNYSLLMISKHAGQLFVNLNLLSFYLTNQKSPGIYYGLHYLNIMNSSYAYPYGY